MRWVDQLSDRSATARQAAAVALAKMGDAAKPAIWPLLAALGDADDSVRDTAAETLSLFGKEVVRPLTDALKNPNPQVRRGAAQALFHMGADAGNAVGPLIAVVKDDADPDVRETAVYSLAAIGPAAKDAVGPLTAIAAGKDANLHGPALMALGGIGNAAVPSLVRLLKEKAPDVRVGACLALGLIGRSAERGRSAVNRPPERRRRGSSFRRGRRFGKHRGLTAKSPCRRWPSPFTTTKRKCGRRRPSRWGISAPTRPGPCRRLSPP